MYFYLSSLRKNQKKSDLLKIREVKKGRNLALFEKKDIVAIILLKPGDGYIGVPFLSLCLLLHIF